MMRIQRYELRLTSRMSTSDTKVFLSYAREDIDAAARLYQSLTSTGIAVWFDKESLGPGAKWKTAISAAIRGSRYFIILLSSRSVSKRGFVQSEIKQALDVLEQYPENETYVIPVRLDQCELTNEKLNELNWVDLFPEWREGQNKLLRFFGVKQKEDQLSIGEGATIALRSLAPTVRVDGLYQAKSAGEGYSKYLRFYADGSVIGVTSTGTAEEVLRWFTQDWAVETFNAEGRFTISGPQISFEDKDMNGTVAYDGEIRGDRLVLKCIATSTIIAEWVSLSLFLYEANGQRGVSNQPKRAAAFSFHFNRAPFGTSSANVAITGFPSSPTDAASSIPCDS
jgi:hypothetical protein